jgi:hypothetical protein
MCKKIKMKILNSRIQHEETGKRNRQRNQSISLPVEGYVIVLPESEPEPPEPGNESVPRRNDRRHPHGGDPPKVRQNICRTSFQESCDSEG